MCQINYGCKLARSHLLQSCDYQTSKSPMWSESLLIKTQSMLSLGFEFQETNDNSFEVTVHHSLKGWVFRLSLSTCAFECIEWILYGFTVCCPGIPWRKRTYSLEWVHCFQTAGKREGGERAQRKKEKHHIHYNRSDLVSHLLLAV